MKKIKYKVFVFGLLSALFFSLQALVSTPLNIIGIELPAGHLIELVATFLAVTLSYIALVIALLKLLPEDRKPSTKLMVIALANLAIFSLGNGIHFAANSIHYFVNIAEIEGALEQITYFYDENLSHRIWITSGIFVPFSFILWEVEITKVIEITKEGILFPILGAMFFGVVIGFGSIEAQVAEVIAIPLCVLLLCFAFLMKKKLELKFHSLPITTFAITFYCTVLTTIGTWGIIFDGFPEPLTIWK